MHHALKQFDAKSLVLDEKKLAKFCNTMMRKATVTNTRKENVQRREQIATLMSHSFSTADRLYDLPNQIAKAASGHETVRNLFATPTKHAHTTTIDNKQDTEDEDKEQEKKEKTKDGTNRTIIRKR